jgi:hypothetical protein
MLTREIGQRLLIQASIRMGGVDALRIGLRISRRDLADYLAGAEPLPDHLLLRLADLLDAQPRLPASSAQPDAKPTKPRP